MVLKKIRSLSRGHLHGHSLSFFSGYVSICLSPVSQGYISKLADRAWPYLKRSYNRNQGLCYCGILRFCLAEACRNTNVTKQSVVRAENIGKQCHDLHVVVGSGFFMCNRPYWTTPFCYEKLPSCRANRMHIQTRTSSKHAARNTQHSRFDFYSTFTHTRTRTHRMHRRHLVGQVFEPRDVIFNVVYITFLKGHIKALIFRVMFLNYETHLWFNRCTGCIQGPLPETMGWTPTYNNKCSRFYVHHSIFVNSSSLSTAVVLYGLLDLTCW